MRKNSGTLNSQLSRVFSELGHTDQVVVTDAGLPIPGKVERVDLALAEGIPSFLQVLDQTLAEIVIQGAVAPAEMEQESPEMLAALRERLDRLGVELTLVPTWSSNNAAVRLALPSGPVSSPLTPTSSRRAVSCTRSSVHAFKVDRDPQTFR